jgi:hypothetical protein
MVLTNTSERSFASRLVRPIRRGLAVLLLVAAACASATPPPAPDRPLFAFQSNFWLNLHHFARAVARGMPAPGELSAAERGTWDEGVAFYHDRYMDRDLLFDEGMVEINNTLRGITGTASLGAAPLDPELRATLERLAPIYRAHWWPAHDAANRAWIAAVEPLVRRHGAALSRRIAASYGRSWPDAPIPVDLSVTAGPVGAYTTSPPTHTTIAPGPSRSGLASLEILFHEASHAWGRELQDAIRKSSEARHKTVPRQLWHAVLFYDAGELTRRTLQEDGVAGYVEYAVKQDVYPRLCGAGCRELVAEAWDPHLDGKVSLAAALDGLVAAWPAE